MKVIHTDPHILNGTPLFYGTRVPVHKLIDTLKSGQSIDVFLRDCPSVTREQVVQVLDLMKGALYNVPNHLVCHAAP